MTAHLRTVITLCNNVCITTVSPQTELEITSTTHLTQIIPD